MSLEIVEIIQTIRKKKKHTFAKPAAAPATPEKPKTAAIIAITRKLSVQCNMIKSN